MACSSFSTVALTSSFAEPICPPGFFEAGDAGEGFAGVWEGAENVAAKPIKRAVATEVRRNIHLYLMRPGGVAKIAHQVVERRRMSCSTPTSGERSVGARSWPQRGTSGSRRVRGGSSDGL